MIILQSSSYLIAMTENGTKNTGNKKKVTKKGIFITAIIVGGIVGASFLIYLLPY
jgi:hypothetical protein